MKTFAIAYDFDGTLAAGNMQEYDFIPALGIDVKAFWHKAGELAIAQDADQILTYMHLMLHEAQYKKVQIRKSDFARFGAKIQLFDGVETWFERINDFAMERGVKVEHFIVSSGLREMIAGTSIAPHFKKIYASGFMYDQHEVAFWPALAVNYTTKTQYLFRINKGSLEVHDNSTINKFVPHDQRPIPFSNMLFIGDGETDIPSMRLVKQQGGHSIAVYAEHDQTAQSKVAHLVNEQRVNQVLPANYCAGGALDFAVKAMIENLGF